ncbi:glycoside hydrolase family 2 [Pedobacter glucosidilyticus]|uniref:glycoside hydrolase family 2 n=1 Tax=Pedobacter glucosidilyticus TaxID=1122941 RepID=UPI00040E2299|nr:glycoside hydrolase family 2 [Pedobacter glucosidilyticus]
MTLKARLLTLILFYSLSSYSQTRIIRSINSNWLFYKGDLNSFPSKTQNINWTKISLPHSWNDKDVFDDEPGYYRGISWYNKTLYIPKEWSSKAIYLHFEGAAQVAEIYIDGKFVGKHIGSYTAFSFSINKYLDFNKEGNNNYELTVKLDNSHNEDIAPLSADFTFFGGIYRDVYLKVIDEIHFDMDNYASNGLFITTPSVNNTTANINVKGTLTNHSEKSEELIITHTLKNHLNEIVLKKSLKIQSQKNKNVDFNILLESIKYPQLWSPKRPYLYTLVSSISEKATGKILDELSHPIGFRWFSFDANKGFFLNGEPLKLIGASRHQDYMNKANALSDALHVKDVELLKEMGGNFLRVAHYPQDPAVLEACDRLGILTSVETPIVNRITESEAFSENAKKMHLEMIRQNYNHPSIIIWAYMNEIMLRPRYEKGSGQQNNYFNKITKLAEELEDITHKEDNLRYTLIPNHENFDLYNKYKLTEIPQLVGWNLYQGWYSGNFKGFDKFLDQHHEKLPHKPLLVTEYGADSDTRIHSNMPERFDKSIEYSTMYHDSYLQAINSRPYIAAALIWNLTEFNSEERADAAPHMNTKGLLTYDRKPKDTYLFYQANLLKTPFLQIGSKEWNLRSGFVDSSEKFISTQDVQVFSNAPLVTLIVNNIISIEQSPVNGIATFKVPFINGKNILIAKATIQNRNLEDLQIIDFKLLNQNLKNSNYPFSGLNVNIGDKRFFCDYENKEIWIPEQSYKPGSWGYIGGEIFRIPNAIRQSYGSDRNILGTNLDPIYQTQRLGISEFKFDVPNGQYEITLHFAELLSSVKKEELAYNLTNQSSFQKFEDRVFDVLINDIKVLSNFNTQEDIIPETAVKEKFLINTQHEKGITISFHEKKNRSIINAIQIQRIF